MMVSRANVKCALKHSPTAYVCVADSICLCMSCPESVVRSTSSVVCVRWDGNPVATYGSRPYDRGLFPRVNHAVRHTSETVRCSAV